MLSKLLLEAPWRLAILWVVLQFIVIAVWSYRRTDRWRRAVWTGFILLPVLLATSVLTITPRERIVEFCQTLAAMAERGDADSIIPHLDDDCRIGQMRSGGCADQIRNALTRYRVAGVRLRRFEVSFEESDVAVATFNSVCTVFGAEEFSRDIFLQWRLLFRIHDSAIGILSVDTDSTPPFSLWDLRP